MSSTATKAIIEKNLSLCLNDSNVSFDTVRENKIMDELTYYNIVCIDVVVCHI